MRRDIWLAGLAGAALAVIAGLAIARLADRATLGRLLGRTWFEPHNAAWREGIQDLYAANADTVVLGDSNSDVVDWTSALGRPVSNRAFSGNTVARQAMRPVLATKTAIFFLGINDLQFGAGVEATTTAYLRLLEAYRRSGARLIVISPFTGVEHLVAPVAELNAALAAKCACTFVDVRPAFGGTRAESKFAYDGIHLTVDGYRELFVAVRRAL